MNSNEGRALVIADGDVPPRKELPPDFGGAADQDSLLVIAADGGLHKARALGFEPDLVIGDGDSLAPDVLESLAGDGVEIQLHPREKDASDTELAVREAMRRGARRVVLVGALGGTRFDHALANVLLLAAPDLDGELTIVDGPTSIRLVGRHDHERLEISGVAGDTVSLLPLSDEVTGVRLIGFAYPLDGATLRQGPSIGLSNELTSAHGTVEVEHGRLAVIHTRTGADK